MSLNGILWKEILRCTDSTNKKPILDKMELETYNFNQEKHVINVCSSNSWTQLMSTLQIFPFFFLTTRSFLFSSNSLQNETSFVHILFEKARGYFVCHITVCGSSSNLCRLLILKNMKNKLQTVLIISLKKQ